MGGSKIWIWQPLEPLYGVPNTFRKEALRGTTNQTGLSASMQRKSGFRRPSVCPSSCCTRHECLGRADSGHQNNLQGAFTTETGSRIAASPLRAQTEGCCKFFERQLRARKSDVRRRYGRSQNQTFRFRLGMGQNCLSPLLLEVSNYAKEERQSISPRHRPHRHRADHHANKRS
jgi:hypothetical protein